MANTKIINLKRYSKKRVPKKVLKGGAAFAKAAHTPRSLARGQREESVPRVSLSPRPTGREGPERGRPPERTPRRRRSERPRDPSSDTVLKTKKYARVSPRSPRSLSPRERRSLSEKEKLRILKENEKLRILKKKLREGDGFVRLSTAAPKLEGHDRDDYILETWGHLIDDNGQRIENFDDIFEEVAKRELTRPPSPPHSPHSPRRRLTGMPRSKSMEMAIKKRQAEANEKKLQFLRRMLGKLKKHDPGAYNKYEINKARIKNLEDLNKYILDIWGRSIIFDFDGNFRHDNYNGDDAVLEELVNAVNRRFPDTANHRTDKTRRGKVSLGDRQMMKAEREAEANEKKLQFLKEMLDKLKKHDPGAYNKYERIENLEDFNKYILDIWGLSDIFNHDDGNIREDDAVLEELAADVRSFGTTGEAARRRRNQSLNLGIMAKSIKYGDEITQFNYALKKKKQVENKGDTTKENTIINKLAEQNRDKIRKTFIRQGCLPGKNDITAVEESLITILNVAEQPFKNIKNKLAEYQQLEHKLKFKFPPSTLTEMLVNERLLSNKISNNSKNNGEYMQYLWEWDAANWELNKKNEINTPLPKKKLEKDLNNSIKDLININCDNENDMFSISIKLNDDLKVPYPYFLDKIKKLDSERINEILVENTNDLLNFIGPEPFSFIENDLKDRLHKYYDVEYRAADNAHDGGAIRGGASTTAEDFIMLMAKWCFIIWGYKTLNKNFCNKYLENKKPSSSYTKEQLSLDYRRKITGITRVYKRDDILIKNQFVIKASLNKNHIPDYKKEINNYEKLWEICQKKYNKKDNKFKVLKYFGSSERWSRGDENNYRKEYSGTRVNNKDVWDYDISNKVLTINNKIDGKHSLKISTNLDKHAEAIDNNGETPTKQVCWFAIEWDPDFIPFSTSHSGGERDLKLDQTVLRNMRENIYHLSKNYGFYHGDLHTENFLYNIKGDIRRFDFDFSGIINENYAHNVPNDQINVYFGWQPSKISMFLFFNLYKNGTWGDNDSNGNMKWNPTASGKQAYPKHQHLEFLKLFDTHRMLLHYFLSTKGPYNTNVNDIKGVIEKIFTEEEEEQKKIITKEEEKHKKILIESVTNNMYTFWNGSATKKEFEKRLDSDMVYENTWNAGCMYSLLWYFGKYKPDDEDTNNDDWKKWYDYDNHLKFFEIHLKNLLKKLEAQKSAD